MRVHHPFSPNLPIQMAKWQAENLRLCGDFLKRKNSVKKFHRSEDTMLRHSDNYVQAM